MNFSPALGESASDPGLGTATAIAKSREVIVVLGMHRSGTSLCMNVLNVLGVRVDNELALDVHNPRGYFEAIEIVRTNDKLLRSAGLNWHAVLSPEYDVRNGEDAGPDALKERLAGFLSKKATFDATPWAVKDPRVCLLLPLYEQLFERCNLRPAYVLCIRDPRSVARSMKKRDNFPEIFSELLWLNHTMGTMRIAGDRIKAVVHYEKWFYDGTEQMRSLAASLGLQNDRGNTSPTAALETVVDPSLNHHGVKADHGDVNSGRFALHGVDKIYRLLLAKDYEGASREFLEFQRWFYGAEQEPQASRHDLVRDLMQALQASAAELVRLRQESAAQDEWRRSVLRSWSWRLTAPVRWSGSFFLD